MCISKIFKKSVILMMLMLCGFSTVSSQLEEFLFQYKITELSISFEEIEEPAQLLDTPDNIKIGFDYFGHNVEVSANKYPESLMKRTTVEIHGNGTNHVGPFRGKFYELENAKYSVSGYLTDNGGFEGIIEMRNVTYNLMQASTYFNDMRSKTIVYRDVDIKPTETLNSSGNRHFMAEEKHASNNNQLKSTNVSNSELSNAENIISIFKNLRMTRKQTSDSKNIMECRVEMIGDAEYFKRKKGNALQYMYLMLHEVDKVFKTTDFGGDTVRLLAWNLSYYETENEPGYPFGTDLSNMDKYLDNFKDAYKKTHREYNSCLTYAVTGYELHGAQGKAEFGGICSQNIKFAIIRTTPDVILKNIFIHEFGHSFGAMHDTEKNASCRPYGKYNYIMGPGIAGENKYRFSPCSIDAIRLKLKDKNVRKCMKHFSPECGNGVKEEGEECDCGPNEHVCEGLDRCCIPKGGIKGEGDKECTYRRSKGYTCSDKSDLCCKNCTVSSYGKECIRENFGCIVGRCDGVKKDCWNKTHEIDGTNCSDSGGGIHTCSSGSCNSSYCRDHGLDTCICKYEFRCRVCCLRDGKCISSETLGFTHHGVRPKLPYGTVCGKELQCNGYGFCRSPTGKYPSESVEVWPYIIALLILICIIVSGSYYYYIIKKKKRLPQIWPCKIMQQSSARRTLHETAGHHVGHSKPKHNLGLHRHQHKGN